MQELRELVAQLRADNARLRHKRTHNDSSLPGPSVVASQPVTAGSELAERFVFVPRDRKCPKCSGRSVGVV